MIVERIKINGIEYITECRQIVIPNDATTYVDVLPNDGKLKKLTNFGWIANSPTTIRTLNYRFELFGVVFANAASGINSSTANNLMTLNLVCTRFSVKNGAANADIKLFTYTYYYL